MYKPNKRMTKLKATNEKKRKTSKNSKKQTILLWLPGKGGGVKIKGVQIYGDLRRFDFG